MSHLKVYNIIINKTEAIIKLIIAIQDDCIDSYNITFYVLNCCNL